MIENYDDALQQLRGAGLLVNHLVADGKMRRCRVEGMDREKRGWYCLHEWRGNDGELYCVGSYGVWQGNDNGATKVKLKGVQISDAEKAAMRARMAEDRKRASAERKREADAAARRAGAAWAKALTVAPPEVAVDYLQRKGIQAHGARYTGSGALVIPMQDARGAVHGLQFILPSHHPRRKKTGRNKEYWPAGLQKQGHWYQLGLVPHGGVVLVAEGFATAASLHEATGLPVAVAFDANNLRPVAAALAKAHATSRVLICADDDYLQTCRACKAKTVIADATCQHCGEPHGAENAGVREAQAAALQVGGAWLAPVFPHDRAGAKLTDFNDLVHVADGGLHVVRQQIEDQLAGLGWRSAPAARRPESAPDAGDAMPSRLTVEEFVARYWGTYGLGGDVLFDAVERRLVHKKDGVNLLARHDLERVKDHPGWRVARDSEIGFDPTQKDPSIKCNLFGGWPTTPKPGKCEVLLDLLYYLVSNETNRDEVFGWVLKWLAYPLQHPGAKMHSAIVVHGPQGTGKSRFFEAYAKIYGPYGRVLDQAAIEDKFNSDWAEKKLFILADEVLARADMFHVKNRLKGFITGDSIRVNPKNVAAHVERNCMNLVFLSNELQPLVLEHDDRRHLVIWVPPKLDDRFFADLNAEIAAGGIEALHHHLLELDLGDFKPWTRPPMTSAKQGLVDLALPNEARFVKAWQNLELEVNGHVLPFRACLGSTLYKVYRAWCRATGEREKRDSVLISYLKRQPGWLAGSAVDTWDRLETLATRDRADALQRRSRRLVVPPNDAIERTRASRSVDFKAQRLEELLGPTYADWEADGGSLIGYRTGGFFAFEAIASKVLGDQP